MAILRLTYPGNFHCLLSVVWSFFDGFRVLIFTDSNIDGLVCGCMIYSQAFDCGLLDYKPGKSEGADDGSHRVFSC